MDGKDLRNVLLYFCNKWCKDESNLIFNGSDFDPDKWQYSLGWHIWNKWLEYCENHHGSLDCIASFLLEIDVEKLSKFVKRAKEIYD